MPDNKRDIPPEDHGMGGVQVGSEPGTDSLARLDTSVEVDERDLKEGQRRKGGQMSGEDQRR